MSLDLDSLERVARAAYELEIKRNMSTDWTLPDAHQSALEEFQKEVPPDVALELVGLTRTLLIALSDAVLLLPDGAEKKRLIDVLVAASLPTPSGDEPREEAESE